MVQDLETRVRAAVARALKSGLEQDALWIPVGVSARHVHLSQRDVERLFGPGYALRPARELLPGQFACEESVTLVGPKGSIPGVRVLGPARSLTQVEIAASDGFLLGIHPPVRLSGDVAGTPGAAIVGPRGAIFLEEGVIVAKRHIHITPDVASAWGLTDGQIVHVEVAGGERTLTFGQVVLRVDPSFRPELHLDTDEANAASVRTGDLVRVVEARRVEG